VELVDNVADELGMDEAGRQELEFAALLHDVGKIAIPTSVLQKPGPLTPEEMRVIQTHTIEGQFMLDRVGGLLCEVGEIVRSSHERWDGHGYPDGLAGEEIPLAARIIGCCDAWNAMTTDRVYREKLPPSKALAELHTCSGTQFDPHVAAAVTRVVERPEEAPRTVSRLRPARAGLPQPGEGAGS
jgi:HD-GYP domain-containing protein (c-di-GMP phosphodiesterase class II)